MVHDYPYNLPEDHPGRRMELDYQQQREEDERARQEMNCQRCGVPISSQDDPPICESCGYGDEPIQMTDQTTPATGLIVVTCCMEALGLPKGDCKTCRVGHV